MKNTLFFLLIAISTLFITSCNGTQKDEVKNDTKEIKTDATANTDKPVAYTTEKTAAEILVGGSWNNPAAARSEDIVFNADGNMFWRSGTDEGEDKWEVKGADVLHFYGKDYQIEELTESKLTVSADGETTTYERNLTDETAECNPTFKVEGINDAKGEYKNGNESWTIHFSEDKFIAFYTKDGKQDEAIVVSKIEAKSNCEFSILMEGIQGEIVPTWTLKYNEEKKFYDLHAYEYDAGADSWSDKVYVGSSDNG
ncbi:MAG: hypothetical protein GY810_17820 [Aureispira sp.]|nr:hypothetical protein [Aureispira sp.]